MFDERLDRRAQERCGGNVLEHVGLGDGHQELVESAEHVAPRLLADVGERRFEERSELRAHHVIHQGGGTSEQLLAAELQLFEPLQRSLEQGEGVAEAGRNAVDRGAGVRQERAPCALDDLLLEQRVDVERRARRSADCGDQARARLEQRLHAIELGVERRQLLGESHALVAQIGGTRGTASRLICASTTFKAWPFSHCVSSAATPRACRASASFESRSSSDSESWSSSP